MRFRPSTLRSIKRTSSSRWYFTFNNVFERPDLYSHPGSRSITPSPASQRLGFDKSVIMVRDEAPPLLAISFNRRLRWSSPLHFSIGIICSFGLFVSETIFFATSIRDSKGPSTCHCQQNRKQEPCSKEGYHRLQVHQRFDKKYFPISHPILGRCWASSE
jgi:hypothetical protein